MNGCQSASLASEEKRNLTDEELLRLCAHGNSNALEEIVRRYQAPLFRFLLRLLNSPEDAEEAALSVFLRAWRSASQFQYRCRVETWLYRIAGNIARDLYRRQKARPEQPWPEQPDRELTAVDSAEATALGRIEREDRAQALQAMLARLGPTDRLLLALYYGEQREYNEIQEITGFSYPVLKTRLTRARQRLRRLMAEEGTSWD